ncbi:hypothetical protein H632_c797p0, partial [Helicosporidium sp. ATCC 50920]
GAPETPRAERKAALARRIKACLRPLLDRGAIGRAQFKACAMGATRALFRKQGLTGRLPSDLEVREAAHAAVEVATADLRDCRVSTRQGSMADSAPLDADVLVVGAGVVGLATARSLGALSGVRGILVDQNRMYREMHSDPYYVHMQRAALPYWRSLERESSTLLLKECGLLFFGDPSTGETVEGSIEGALDTMRAGSMKHEHMKSLAELCERWPLKIAARARDEETSSAQSSPVDWQGIWDPRAGWVRASRAVAALASQVERNPRWQVMRGVGVAGLAADGRGVCARLADGRRVRAKKLVLACGAWTGDVLGLLGKRMELEIWRMHWGYCAAGEAALRRVPMWYCFQKPKERQGGLRDGGLYYGFPAEEEVGWSRVDEKPLNSHAPSTHPHARQLKVGIDWVPEGEEFRPRSMAQFDSRPSPVMRSLLESFLERHWEGMGPLDHLVVSPYSMTPDLNFVLGQLPDLENVFIFAGDCGRAFKFAPLLGQCLAEKVLGRPTSFDVAPLDPGRACLQYRQRLPHHRSAL